jgi:plastocyanin
MRLNKHTVGLVAAGVAVSLALAGAAAAALMGHRSAHATRVTVTESEYTIAVAPAKLQAGTTTFVVRNRGKLAHALDISGPGLKTVKVPTIAPGKSRTVTVKLGGGTFKLWCPIPGHAALGMTRSLTVTGAAAPGGATSGGGTTPPGTTTNSGDAWG